MNLCTGEDDMPVELKRKRRASHGNSIVTVVTRHTIGKTSSRPGTAHYLSPGPLTIPPNVVAKNHLFSAFLSATKSQNFVQKDNDLIFFWKIGPKNDNDLFPPKICPEILKMHGNGL